MKNLLAASLRWLLLAASLRWPLPGDIASLVAACREGSPYTCRYASLALFLYIMISHLNHVGRQFPLEGI